MRIKIYILFFLIGLFPILFSYSGNQVFYTSNTKVEYNSGTKSLEFSTKFFTRNLEQAVGDKIEDPSFDAAMSAYLKNNFHVLINGVPRPLKYAGKQVTIKAVRIYYEVSDVSSNMRTLEIKNALLIDEFPSQQNFVNIEIKNRRASFICKKGDETGKVLF